jgi:hypothetical protein
MANLILNGSTSGSVTLSSPAVSGTTTLTLPTTTSTLAINGPAFSAYQSSTQAISAATFTKLQINSIATTGFDTNSNFNISTYRFTPTIAGYYQINGGLQYAANPGTFGIVSIYKNGAEFFRGTQGSNVESVVSALIYFNGSTDYVELYGFATNASTASSGNVLTYFNGFLARSA